MQPGGRARRLDRHVGAAPGGALDRRAGAVRRVGGSIASSAPSSSASSRRAGDRVDGGDARRARQPRHLHEQQADRAEADHRDVVAELDPRVVGGDERDRADADEQPALERLAVGRRTGG